MTASVVPECGGSRHQPWPPQGQAREETVVKVRDLRKYPDDTEILIEGESGIPQPPMDWEKSIMVDASGSHSAIVLTPAEETR